MKQVKSRQEVADEYGISTKTLYRWIKKMELNINRGLLCPKELEKIYERFGDPNLVKKNKQKNK